MFRNPLESKRKYYHSSVAYITAYFLCKPFQNKFGTQVPVQKSIQKNSTSLHKSSMFLFLFSRVRNLFAGEKATIYQENLSLLLLSSSNPKHSVCAVAVNEIEQLIYDMVERKMRCIQHKGASEMKIFAGLMIRNMRKSIYMTLQRPYICAWNIFLVQFIRQEKRLEYYYL